MITGNDNDNDDDDDYDDDHSFWESTMITEWDLVCENSWLKTLAKLLLFTGETSTVKILAPNYTLMILRAQAKPPEIVSVSHLRSAKSPNFMNVLLTPHVRVIDKRSDV